MQLLCTCARSQRSRPCLVQIRAVLTRWGVTPRRQGSLPPRRPLSWCRVSAPYTAKPAICTGLRIQKVNCHC